MEMIIHTEKEIPAVAEALLDHAAGKRKFAFYGEIGAGKTTLIQTLCRQLGVEDYVTSPTFGLVHVYQSPHGPVSHLDLYRLQTLEEALDIGIEDHLYDEAYCFLEWPELIETLLPDNIVRIKIELLPDSSRKILFL